MGCRHSVPIFEIREVPINYSASIKPVNRVVQTTLPNEVERNPAVVDAGRGPLPVAVSTHKSVPVADSAAAVDVEIVVPRPPSPPLSSTEASLDVAVTMDSSSSPPSTAATDSAPSSSATASTCPAPEEAREDNNDDSSYAEIAVAEPPPPVSPAPSADRLPSPINEHPSTAFVLDCGSGACKVGFAGEDAPRVVFPSLVGRPKHAGVMLGAGVDHRDAFVGEDAQARRGVLALSRPIERGAVSVLDDGAGWEGVELLWRHAFDSALRVPAAELPVLLTEAPMSPPAGRERAAQIMFEVFGVPALHIANTAVLSLYATGRTTGVVLDAGDGISHAVPVYEGYALPHAVQRLEVAGRDVTDCLASLLAAERGHAFTTAAEREIVRDAKERLAYVALDYEAELARATADPESLERAYELPDGNVVTLGAERFRCAEALFRPSLVGKAEAAGVHAALFEAVSGRCDVDIRRDLYAAVVLSGGSTLFPGTAARLQREMIALVPAGTRVGVVAEPERRFGAWLGGSILAMQAGFADQCISRAEYDEAGPSIVHRKCF